ncbi:hypothetical protein ATANTOWER_007357 [Ataeniobius toweri]|uniref:Gamma-butyrobetaine hydroxylase-like N-terminal domain-containing protein n=1 Tax=Ataeniobius toweri TaxID=208326 RepID=A0ABU7A9V0_9TELE|nr:hypothetical protein [Ataeniobius toweri]
MKLLISSPDDGISHSLRDTCKYYLFGEATGLLYQRAKKRNNAVLKNTVIPERTPGLHSTITTSIYLRIVTDSQLNSDGLRLKFLFIRAFHRVVSPSLREAQLLSARTEPRMSWGYMLQLRSAASATFRLLEDSLGEFNNGPFFKPYLCTRYVPNDSYPPAEVSHGGTPMRFNYVWLRDHCRSASSYNSSTHQRSLDTGSVELTVRPESSAVEDDQLVLTWPDGHVSKYSLSWLAKNSYEGRKKATEQPRVLWNANIYQNASISSIKWNTFMSCDNELKKFLQNYLLYGIAFVDDVPTTVEATEEVTQRVSLIR